MRRTAMKPSQTPMRRSSPLLRKALKKRAKRVSAQTRREYEIATERVRDPEGFLVCDACHQSIREGDEQRHHVDGRVYGTHADRLEILHRDCHGKRHGQRFSVDSSARSYSGGGNFGAAVSVEPLPAEGTG